MESRRPKPVRSSAVQPEIPISVMKNLFLYLIRFLADTLYEKESLLHIGVIRSRNTFFPLAGGFGRISCAGTDERDAKHAHSVTAQMQTTATEVVQTAYFMLNSRTMSNVSYIIVYVCIMTDGNIR